MKVLRVLCPNLTDDPHSGDTVYIIEVRVVLFGNEKESIENVKEKPQKNERKIAAGNEDLRIPKVRTKE